MAVLRAMLIALLNVPKRVRRAQRRKVRATCGSKVRRSLVSILLIAADLAQSVGKNITGTIIEGCPIEGLTH